ncbi:MAG TPA: hypothetical protein PK648_09725 [Verrucomicrobiales bacterium]|nr:hypothetical protein [Verrucomicrobiales bacterium]
MANPLVRRNFLFVLTALTLVAVFVGAVPLGPYLMANPLWFSLFWCVSFLFVVFVLVLAVYDLTRVRRDHRRRVRELEKDLAVAAADAREMARQHAEDLKREGEKSSH